MALMAIIEKHNPGSFTWIELGTTDQNAAKAFYTALFGWSVNDVDMGPAGVYTIFELEGRSVAAAYTQSAGEKSMGVPPHWNLYMAVESTDAAVERVKELGGSVVMGPFDVNQDGRMAVALDTTGASFCLWQARNNIGIGLAGVEGTLCWADVFAGHGEGSEAKSTQFYSDLFGYRIVHGDEGYTHLWNGEVPVGGVQNTSHVPPGVPPHWLIYILVNDCAAHTAKARELGGRVMVEPMEIEKTGYTSLIGDPQGAMFALFQPFPRQS